MEIVNRDRDPFDLDKGMPDQPGCQELYRGKEGGEDKPNQPKDLPRKRSGL